MGKVRESATNKKVAPYVTAGLALQVVSLFGFAYATDSHVPGVSLLAATSIFIDGTKDILPTNDSQATDRMRDALMGVYDQCGATSTGPCADNIYIEYPRSMGVLTGLHDPTFDASKTVAVQNTIAAIKTARLQNPGTPGNPDPIYVVAYSQGAYAASDAIKQIEQNNAGLDPSHPDYVDLTNVTFVLLANPARNDGGIAARFPAGVYVPLIGITFGSTTNPIPGGPQVIQISKQYDGASDVPKYVMNPVAWANTAMGFLYVHNGYYQDVDISDLDTNGDGKLSDLEITAADPDKYIITTNENIVDVVIKNPVGQLPLTRPLLDMGVPPEVVEALDPFLRAMIEAGYDRPPNGGEYPAEPVPFRMIPGPSQWLTDFTAIAEGFDQSADNLAALDPSTVTAASPSIAATSGPGVGQSVMAKQLDPALPIEPAKPKPNWQGSPLSTFIPAPTRVWTPPLPPAEVPPPPSDVPPPPAEIPPATPTDNSPTSNLPQRNVVRGPIGGSPSMPGLNSVRSAINGVVTGTVKAITGVLGGNPPSTGGSTGGTTDPDPDPGTGTDPGTGGGSPDPGTGGATP